MAAPQPSGANFLLKFNKQNKKSIKKMKYKSLSPRDKIFKAFKDQKQKFPPSINQVSKDSEQLLQDSIERVKNNKMML